MYKFLAHFIISNDVIECYIATLLMRVVCIFRVNMRDETYFILVPSISLINLPKYFNKDDQALH